MSRIDVTSSVWGNLTLITAGTILWAIGINGLIVPHSLLQGGVLGVALLIHYAVPALSPALLNLLLNIPLFAAGWFKVSRRFFLYSLYATVALSVFLELFPVTIHIKNQLYAAITAGVICGAGSGMILRTLGSGGGLDILAIILNRKYNIGIGKFFMACNALVFGAGFINLDPDLIIVSMVMVFTTAMTMDYVLSLFSQRKMVLVVSDLSDQIAERVTKNMRLRGTFLKGFGAYTRQEKNVLLTVINNIQLKQLEEAVFAVDPCALFIVENTFNVLGCDFSRRKMY